MQRLAVLRKRGWFSGIAQIALGSSGEDAVIDATAPQTFASFSGNNSESDPSNPWESPSLPLNDNACRCITRALKQPFHLKQARLQTVPVLYMLNHTLHSATPRHLHVHLSISILHPPTAVLLHLNLHSIIDQRSDCAPLVHLSRVFN